MTELRERIRASGLKLGWIADQVGVHKTTVRRWKNSGMRPKPDHVERLLGLFEEHERESERKLRGNA